MLETDAEWLYPEADKPSAYAEARLPAAIIAETSASLLSPRVPAEQVRLLAVDGRFLRLVGPDEAHALIRERRAIGLGTRTKIREVQLVSVPAVAVVSQEPCVTLRPDGLVGTRYSDKHEHPDNPVNVWRLKPLTAKDPVTDLHIHLCHVDSLLAAMTPRERACFIEGLGAAHGVPARDLKRFLEPSESTGKR